MPNDSRLDVMEGRVEELSRHWDRLFGEIGRLDHKIDTLGIALSARIDALDQTLDRGFEAIDRRFDAIDRRFDGVDGRFETIDRRFELIDRRFEMIDRRFETIDRRFETIDRRFDTNDRHFAELRAELSKQFRWTFSTMLALLGMMLTVGAGVATALLR